ncbi:MAG: hypothetical protein U5J95_04865 [Balneolaceae bacterium]|nr:hypothetical protein [Balneolaceae bacterium]
MSQTTIEKKLRGFLIGTAGFILLGMPIELLILEHTKELEQWIPFVCSGMGVAVILYARLSPSAKSLHILRWTMIVIAAASFVGVYQHFMANYDFSIEIHPTYTLMENVWAGIMGSTPLLAPGIYFLAPVLAIFSTYKHPMLESKG